MRIDVRNIFLCVLLCFLPCLINGQTIIREDGTVASFSTGYFSVDFFGQDKVAGPTFYIQQGSVKEYGAWESEGSGRFSTHIGHVSARLQYLDTEEVISFNVTLRNEGKDVFAPTKAGIALGIDTYMEEYPQWLSKFFPTLMMCEKTHFYGYMQSPQGHVLAVSSTDPVASWSVDYNLSYYDIPEFWFYGHRIESVNLDLLNALPLPGHHPHNLWKLEPSEEMSWTISIFPVRSLDSFEEETYAKSGFPMLDMSRTTYSPGDCAVFNVLSSEKPQISIVNENGCVAEMNLDAVSDGLWQVEAVMSYPGQYDVTVDASGYKSSAVLLVNESWEEVIKDARAAALENHQKPSSHVESWYGFHSAFLAARHFPDKELDEALDRRFDLVYNKVFDSVKAEPKLYGSRIQNTSSTIGMLVDRYQAYGRIEDLQQASALADWLIANNQAESGAYMNGGVRYTSVIYVAKSMMELYLAERELAGESLQWKEKAHDHYVSIKRAIDELVASKGDFQTEGEMTFEDGMISCSALQVGMFALLQEDPKERKYYTDAMLDILYSHDCLTQLKVADARRRGGTMRFWEAQYDVLMLPNMFCSPHGWSAWRAYASYYAYLLTLDERYLLETFNAAGAFANLIDRNTGKLRWAFVLDPYLHARQIAQPVEGLAFDDVTMGNPHPEFYGARDFVIGEQYVDMISSWQPANSQDNDVHEVFKFIAEAVLVNAYVVEREDGSVVGYNCKVERKGRRLIVTPYEKQIVNLHTNLKSDYKVIFKSL